MVHSYKHCCHENTTACSLLIVNITVNNVIKTESVATQDTIRSPFVALPTRMSLPITFRAMSKVADILSDLTKFGCSRMFARKSPIKLQANPFSGRRPDTYGRTIGYTDMTKLTDASRNYANSTTAAVRNCVKHTTIS